MVEVPCNGCTACCHGDVMLHPALGDDHRKFKAERMLYGYRLQRRADGSCIYLEPGQQRKCSIWPDTPGLCRAFDCREYVRAKLYEADPLEYDAVTEAGKKLLSR